jgi:hypothetical protein
VEVQPYLLLSASGSASATFLGTETHKNIPQTRSTTLAAAPNGARRGESRALYQITSYGHLAFIFPIVWMWVGRYTHAHTLAQTRLEDGSTEFSNRVILGGKTRLGENGPIDD